MADELINTSFLHFVYERNNFLNIQRFSVRSMYIFALKEKKNLDYSLMI